MQAEAKRRRRREGLARQVPREVDGRGAGEVGGGDSAVGGTNANAEPTLPGSSGSRRGWVFNIVPTMLSATNDDGVLEPVWVDGGATGLVGAGTNDRDDGPRVELSAVKLFLIDKENRRLKCLVVHEPYFYLVP